MINNNYLKNVRNQYENYPFPFRDPEKDKVRLLTTFSDYLPKINHYCFAGQETFENNFRVLVVGAGTGDATLFLAEQLKETNAQIFHLDMSENSIRVAKERAQVRGLENIQWLHESLLNLSKLGLEPFDYINCHGVLHHLEIPEDGLKSLGSVLKPKGGMCISLYGLYGKQAVYHTQTLLSMINDREEDIQGCITNTKNLIDCLPSTNWLIRGSQGNETLKRALEDDAMIYDTFLHSNDKPYTVLEIYDFVEQAGLQFVEFTGYTGDDANPKQLYNPASFLKKYPELLEKIRNKPKRIQQAVGEIIVSSRGLHVFYVARSNDTIASLDNPDNVPFFFMQPPKSSDDIAAIIKDNPQSLIEISHHYDTKIRFVPKKYTEVFFRHLNGKNSIGEIVKLIVQEFPQATFEEIISDFREIYEAFFEIDLLLLKDKKVRLY